MQYYMENYIDKMQSMLARTMVILWLCNIFMFDVCINTKYFIELDKAYIYADCEYQKQQNLLNS